MRSRRQLLGILAFPLFITAILVVVWIFRQEVVDVVRNRDLLRGWIKDQGGWGMLAFVAIQVLQVILFVLPGEVVQVAGGYAFGFWLSSLLSVLGILAGSVVNFYVGRILGRPFVEGVFGAERVGRIEAATGSRRGAVGFFLFFLIPGIPKDALCYVAGMSRLGLATFMVISMAGRLPGILGSAYMGSASHARSWTSAIAVLVVASLLFVLGLLFKRQIEGLVAKASCGKAAEADEAGK